MSCLTSESLRFAEKDHKRRRGADAPGEEVARASADAPPAALHQHWIPWESLDELRPRWFRNAARAGIEREGAEDLFQEALLASLEGLDRLRIAQGQSLEQAFRAWFWGILRHKLISELRRRRRHRRFVEVRAAEEPPAGGGARETRVRSTLGLFRGASPEAARILHLRYWEGQELREMALALGVSVPTACRRVQSALDEIRGCMMRTLS